MYKYFRNQHERHECGHPANSSCRPCRLMIRVVVLCILSVTAFCIIFGEKFTFFIKEESDPTPTTNHNDGSYYDDEEEDHNHRNHPVAAVDPSQPRKKNRRILLADFLFPIDISKWRIEEIYSFIEEYYTDILVDRSPLPAAFKQSNLPGPSYEKLDYRFLLSRRYDILIFDPKWNHLNIYNTDGFNGTVFNGQAGGPESYLLRRKEFRNETKINWEAYDACYHIFLMMFHRLKWIPIPEERQWIHVYPGGGLLNRQSLDGIPPSVGLVVTQIPVLHWVQSQLPRNEVVFALGGTFLQRNSLKVPKRRKEETDKIAVCFTQASGNALEKGDAFFEQSIRGFAASFPDLWKKTIVYTVGRARPITNLSVINMGVMDQERLDAFYRGYVDIYINTETGLAFNGWPLGSEALLQGAVGITTDSQGMNAGFNFTDEEIFIVPTMEAGVPHIIQALARLTNDTDLLYSMSQKIQRKVHELFAFSNSQAKVFAAIDARIENRAV